MLDRQESCFRTCVSLHFDGKRLDDFAEIHSIEGLKDDSVIKILEGVHCFCSFFYVFSCSMSNRLYTTIHINEAISLVILRALLKFITYLKEFMVSDWLTAMC